MKMRIPEFYSSKRFFVAVLLFLGMVGTTFLSSNLNIAIIAMTSVKTMVEDNGTITSDPEFDWDSKTKGMILGASAYGTLFAPLGGHLALKFGGSTMIGLAVLAGSILTLLSPLAAYYHLYIFLVVRILVGICAIFKFVSISEMWSRWSPIQDRSKLIAIGFAGSYAGSSIAYLTCGYIIHVLGWPAVFYITGALASMWALAWLVVVPDDPSLDKWISKEELTVIKHTQNQTTSSNTFAIWKNIVKSKSVWALCSAKFVYNSGLTMVVTCLPLYIKDLTNAEIHQIGILASIPNITGLFIVPLTGCVIDTIQNRGFLTTTQVHKLFLCIGCVGCSALIFSTAVFSSQFAVSIICLTIFKALLSTTFVVTNSVAIYMAPQCSSIVTAFIAMFYHLAAVVIPIMVGFIVSTHDSAEWSTCFVIIGVILLTGAGVFSIFGSSEPQPWSRDIEEENCHESPNKNIE